MSGKAVQMVSEGAEVSGAFQALIMNIGAAKALMDLLKTNLGPKGTLKMLVSGAGEVKITKAGGATIAESGSFAPRTALLCRPSRWSLKAFTALGAKMFIPRSSSNLRAGALMSTVGAAACTITYSGLGCSRTRNIGQISSRFFLAVSFTGNRVRLCVCLTVTLQDGQVLLSEMQIQHPSAALIARSATAVDEAIGDGTTTQVLLVGELLRQCEHPLAEGVHPRNLTEGLDLGRVVALAALEKFKGKCFCEPCDKGDVEKLLCVARCALRTKVEAELADALAPMVTDAVRIVAKPSGPIDLFMVEILSMQHRSSMETRLVRGLVLDHGGRHPGMPKSLRQCFVLAMNVSLEYEKTEVNSEAVYRTAEERDRMVVSERKFIDDRVRRIVDLKRSVCAEGSGCSFVILNQKGIDPPSLDMLAKEGILALRRAKRRNMERVTLACGGRAVNSVEDLHPSDLGRAEHVYEQVLGEDKFTFVEGVANPSSCTLLIKGPTRHAVEQTKDAVRDGLRAVKNTMQDGWVVRGGGACEVALSEELLAYAATVPGRPRLGVEVLAQALLVVPKTLARNAGFDATDALLELRQHPGLGLDLATGRAADMRPDGIYDLYRVKRQILHSATVLASQLLLVDEVLRATGPAPQRQQ